MIVFNGVSKHYGPLTALDNLSLTVHSGSSVALLGRNGAGKSTAIGILLGHTRSDQGTVSIGGRPIREVRSIVGGLAQLSAYPPNIQVGELMRFVKAHYPTGPSLEDLSDLFDLTPIWRTEASTLSGGQARRLGVAIALSGDPQYLILDEPTTGLDPLSRRHLWLIFKRFHELGGTLLFTTHDMLECEELATDIVVLSRGSVALKGTLKSLPKASAEDHVSFRVTDAQEADLTLLQASFQDGFYTMIGDADQIVRELVTNNVPFRDIRIERSSIESVYLDANDN